MYQQRHHNRSALGAMTAALVLAAFLLAPQVANAQDPLEGLVVPNGHYEGPVKIKIKLPFVDAEKDKSPYEVISFTPINVALYDGDLLMPFITAGSTCLDNGGGGNSSSQPAPNFDGLIVSSERTTTYTLDVQSLADFMGPYIETVLCDGGQGIAAYVEGNGEGEVWAQGLQYPETATSVHVDVDLEFVVYSYASGEEIGKAAVEIQFNGEYAGF